MQRNTVLLYCLGVVVGGISTLTIMHKKNNKKLGVPEPIKKGTSIKPVAEVLVRYSGDPEYPTENEYPSCEEDIDLVNYRQYYYQTKDIVTDGPYVIFPGQYFEECDSYRKIVLKYFEDGDLEYVGGDELEEYELTNLSFTFFDELSSCIFDMDLLDTVYVRNDKIATDYEILKMRGASYYD